MELTITSTIICANRMKRRFHSNENLIEKHVDSPTNNYSNTINLRKEQQFRQLKPIQIKTPEIELYYIRLYYFLL